MKALLGFPLLELLFCGCLVCGPDGRRSERKRLKDRIVVHCTVFALLCCAAVLSLLHLSFTCLPLSPSRNPLLFSFFSLIFLSLNPTQFKANEQQSTHSSTLQPFFFHSSLLCSLSNTAAARIVCRDTHKGSRPVTRLGESLRHPPRRQRPVRRYKRISQLQHSLECCSIQHGGNTANTGI